MATRNARAASGKTVEQEQVESAPVVEDTATATAEVDTALEESVKALIEAQFGGEDNEPQEGVERWDDMVREMVIEADKLETAYRDVLKKKEDNRTLLRAFAGMEKLPADISKYYYPERKRLTKKEREAKKAEEAAASNG